MKAVAIYPGKPDSAHLANLSMPRLEDVSGGRGVLVKVLRVGLDGTDRETLPSTARLPLGTTSWFQDTKASA